MAKYINILIVNPSPELGGGTTISNNLALGLDKNIFRVYSFFPAKGPASEELNKDEHITNMFSRTPGLWSVIRELRKILVADEIDIVHAQGTRAAFWVKLAYMTVNPRPKFVYTLHGLHIAHRPAYERPLFLALERFLNKLVDRLVCVSDSVKVSVDRCRIIKKSKIVTIYNGIDIARFASANPASRRSLNIPDGVPLVSAVQRLDYPKDVSMIIRAFKEVKKVVPAAFLLIFGKGPLLGRLESEARSLGLSNDVIFLSGRSDIPEILAASDVVVLSSKYEALGLSLIEAMAAKKPVVGTDVEGINEVIQDGENGFLVTLGDGHEMSSKIVCLLQNDDLRKKMGSRGFDSIKNKFDVKNMVSAYGDLYKSLLN
jgi:glycosyltransferase involved in cell wall biosynthesis